MGGAQADLGALIDGLPDALGGCVGEVHEHGILRDLRRQYAVHLADREALQHSGTGVKAGAAEREQSTASRSGALSSAAQRGPWSGSGGGVVLTCRSLSSLSCSSTYVWKDEKFAPWNPPSPISAAGPSG